jgi:cytoskeletal protein CcmA (bactofilin family)
MFARRNKAPSIEITQLASLIAEGVEVTGDIAFASGVRIDGHVKGNVLGRRGEGESRALLVLSDKGRIDGSVQCGDALVNGTVNGDLDVEHFLELQAHAQVNGTIRYRKLEMHVGAVVQGQLIKVEAAAGGQVVELAGDRAAERAADSKAA